MHNEPNVLVERLQLLAISKIASIAQVMRLVTDRTIRLNRIPKEPLE